MKRSTTTAQTTRDAMMRQTTRALLGGALMLGAATAMAGPQPTSATEGVAFDNPAAGVTNITAPDNAIIHYASFDIAAGETVNFLQPGASARVLNRIQSATPTRIDGTLNANGIVYLVNPSGVVFGPNSVVDAAGLFAAAGSISDADFVSNVNRFTALQGAVTQFGTVRAETIAALIGREVFNGGTISVPNGSAVLASGQSVLIGNPRGGVYVQLDATPREDADGGAVNDGTIDAKHLSLVAGDVFALAAITENAIETVTLSITLEQADTDGDGDIDFDDINTAIANYTLPQPAGTGGKTQQQGDTDGDGDVDDTDLGTLFVLYTGPITPPPPIDPTIGDDANLDDVSRLPAITTVVNLTEADLSILAGQLGITPRALTARERIELAENRALYNDLSPTFDRSLNPDGSITVTNARLDADVVRRALALYRDRLEVQGVTPTQRTAQIKASVDDAVKDYASETAQGEGFDADRFVDYLFQESPTLLSELNALESLRVLTLSMGLSEREQENSDRVIVERTRPESLSFEQMKATLESAGNLSLAPNANETDAG
ncbi:MAG: filamentous hemagglutinin N-terminal domain-containing protein [Phycisphaeraceae bacterium]